MKQNSESTAGKVTFELYPLKVFQMGLRIKLTSDRLTGEKHKSYMFCITEERGPYKDKKTQRSGKT